MFLRFDNFIPVQFISVAQSCLTLCDTINYSTPGFSVHYQLQELSQTHIHRVGNAIQQSHPLSSPSPPAFNLTILSSVITFSSCLQSSGSFPMSRFFTLGSQKYWSCSFSISPSNQCSGLISFRIDWFDPLKFKGFSRVFSNTTVQKPQFFGAQLSSQSNSHIHT